MSWILLAIIGHLANAITFIVDKTLLSSTWKSSATYATLISILSGVAVLASPWVSVWPHGQALVSSILFGTAFVLSVWAFFEALRRAEASRVVPIVGSLSPLFTLLGTSVFLGESISRNEITGFALLLLSTLLLVTGTQKIRLDIPLLVLSVSAALLFGISSVAGKDAFTHASFLSVLITSRLAAALLGCIIGLSAPQARTELVSMFTKKRPPSSVPHAFGLTILGQTCGSISFILVNLAIAKGSAPIVNALQAVQYAAIVLVAWLGGKTLQTALHEDLSRRTLIQKGIAIVCVGAGLWFVAG